MVINEEQVATGRIERAIPFLTGTEPVVVGMDDLTRVTNDYTQYDNEFTGKIHKIVVDVGHRRRDIRPAARMAQPGGQFHYPRPP